VFLNTIEPILQGTSVITVLLFILSILPKGGLSRKKLMKTSFVLSEEAKSHDIAYLKEIAGFFRKRNQCVFINAYKRQGDRKRNSKTF